MDSGIIILLAVFVPLTGAFLLPVAGRFSAGFRNISALILTAFPFILSLWMIAFVLKYGPISFIKYFPFGFNLTLNADALSLFMAITSASISSVIVLYSFGYISHYENQNEYYCMVVFFLASMMGLVFSANLIFLYIFWEMTAIASWRLIGFFREKDYVLKADKAFLITMFGALLMLLGFIRLYQETGSFDLAAIKEAFEGNSISGLTVFLILAGIFSKSATLPFHTWLPDAGVAPSPVTALLHAAVLVKIGVYVYARIFIDTVLPPEFWRFIVLFIAGISALVAGGAAFIETDIKRIVAYSTISQIGFIFLGFASGTSIGIAGALLYIFMHGIAKAGLFLSAGIIEQNTKTKDITKLGGLVHKMPVTALSFLFCSFSVMGIPPFGGFFSKYMVMRGIFEKGNIFIGSIFLIAAFFTMLYLFRMFSMVFMGEEKIACPKEGSRVMVGCVLFLAVISLVSGIFIGFFRGVICFY